MGVSREGRGWRLWCLAALLLLGVIGAGAEEPCIKRVFGSYCLGGDVTALLRAGPPQPLFQEAKGERLALVFSDGAEWVYVVAFRDTIYKVVRRYRAATQLRYEELYDLLSGKYGPGEDRSSFPAYATTAARKQSSIRRGEGQAIHAWKPADTWHIELTWTREMGLALAYLATALDEQQKAAAETGL